jgi:hypothetical protein
MINHEQHPPQCSGQGQRCWPRLLAGPRPPAPGTSRRPPACGPPRGAVARSLEGDLLDPCRPGRPCLWQGPLETVVAEVEGQEGRRQPLGQGPAERVAPAAWRGRREGRAARLFAAGGWRAPGALASLPLPLLSLNPPPPPACGSRRGQSPGARSALSAAPARPGAPMRERTPRSGAPGSSAPSPNCARGRGLTTRSGASGASALPTSRSAGPRRRCR